MSTHQYEAQPKQRRRLRLPQCNKSNRLMRRYYAETTKKERPKETQQ